MKFLSPALTLIACIMLMQGTALAEEHSVSKYTETSPSMNMEISWQRFGIPGPDQDADDVVRQAIKHFRAEAAQEWDSQQELAKEQPDFSPRLCEMTMEGTLSVNAKTAGMLWKCYRYMGGAHGDLSLFSRNYTIADGRPFSLTDLFRHPEKALKIMSRLSRKQLSQRDIPQDMAEGGTTPEKENFQTFLLEERGLTIYFSPYQVAPWSEGVVTVTLTLDELRDAEPIMTYWK